MKTILSVILFMLLVACGGCISASDDAVRPLRADSIWHSTALWVEYIALPDYSAQPHTRPMPLYPDWSVNRMKSDITQLRNANISGVLLRFTPQDLVNDAIWLQLKSFSEYAHKNGISLMIYLESDQPVRLSYHNLIQWFKQKRYDELPAVWRDAQCKPSVLLGPHIECAGQMPAASPLRLLRVGVDYPSEPATADAGALSTINAICWCRARAGNVAALRQQLQNAAQLKPRIIIISSWNDWAHGTFIQPDSANRNAFCKMINSL